MDWYNRDKRLHLTLTLEEVESVTTTDCIDNLRHLPHIVEQLHNLPQDAVLAEVKALGYEPADNETNLTHILWFAAETLDSELDTE